MFNVGAEEGFRPEKVLEAGIEPCNQDCNEKETEQEGFDPERYKKWLKTNLDKHPYSFNLFALDMDDFHDLMVEAYPETVQTQDEQDAIEIGNSNHNFA